MAAAQHSSATTEHRSDYWDEYYAARATTRRPLPSQFATFVAGELDRPHHVIELGCGNGRDAIFFASYGHEVTAVDGSEAAVAGCASLAEALGETATFIRSAIDDPTLADRLVESDGPKALYARFFVHAITDGEEEVFLDLAAKVTRPGDVLAVEYRTDPRPGGCQGDRDALPTLRAARDLPGARARARVRGDLRRRGLRLREVPPRRRLRRADPVPQVLTWRRSPPKSASPRWAAWWMP